MSSIWDESKVRRGNANSRSQFAVKEQTGPEVRLRRGGAPAEEWLSLPFQWRDRSGRRWDSDTGGMIPRVDGVRTTSHKGYETVDGYVWQYADVDGETYRSTGFEATAEGVKKLLQRDNVQNGSRNRTVFSDGDAAAAYFEEKWLNGSLAIVNGELFTRVIRR